MIVCLYMSHSLVSNHIHLVFATKGRERCLTPEIRERIWKYLGGIARDSNLKPIVVGGYDDHCHLLISIPPTVSIAQAVKLLKGSSSRWISQTFPELKNFAWQPGYGAFGIGVSQIDRTIQYINNQEEHHSKNSFEEEYVGFLDHHHISFDRKTLWQQIED